MFATVKLLAETNFSLLVFSVLIFDIPRYSLSLLSLALFGAWRRSDRVPASNASVSVVIPTFNGGSGLGPTIASLQQQTLRPFEIIVVDDGSTDETRAVAERARALLGAAIRGLYQHALPYRGVSPAEQWVEQTHRRLHARAREVFGADAWKVVPPLAVEPLPMPVPGPGPRSPFR